MKEYYKVVCLAGNDTFASYNAPARTLTVNYTLGREIVAPIGGLLVFDDWQYADKFRRFSRESKILVCHGWDPVPLPPERFYCFRESELNTDEGLTRWICEELWRGVYHHEIARYHVWPRGTVAVKRLRPVEYINIQ